ncbi:MAG: hypothetical protein Q9227_004710 [Pyrenula ochraceoflavens]
MPQTAVQAFITRETAILELDTALRLYLLSDIPPLRPTKSPSLDALLHTWRAEFVIPWALNKIHRGLLFNRKNGHATLNQDPGIIVQSRSGEEFRLQPLPEKRHDSHRNLSRELIDKMFEAGDFSNLPVVFEGFEIAKSPLSNWEAERAFRKANEAEQTDVVMNCVELVKKTKLGLNRRREPARELFLGLHMLGEKSGWKGDGLAQALRQAEKMARMLEREGHKEMPRTSNPSSPDTKETNKNETTAYLGKMNTIPLQATPEFIGLLLELSAAQAINDFAGKDSSGKVQNYASKVLAVWPNGNWETPQPGDPFSRAQSLENWVPLFHGLRLAERVEVDGGLKERVREKRGELGELVGRVREEVRRDSEGRETKRRAELMFDGLT